VSTLLPPNREALAFLDLVIADPKAIGVLYGADDVTRAGIIGEFSERTAEHAVVLDVDGTRIGAPALLSALLEQLGYEVALGTTREQIDMVRVVVVHHARNHNPPVLVLRNFNAMYPSALAVICDLANQRAGDRFALRMILVADRYFRRIIESPNMRPVARRIAGRLELSARYDVPTLIVSSNGRKVAEVALEESRTLIGRSEFCDVVIESDCVSRQHAMVIRKDDAVMVFDLRSRNGIQVNNERVEGTSLRNNDIIAIGDYVLKLVYPDGIRIPQAPAIALGDTAKMKTLAEARRERMTIVPPRRTGEDSAG